MADTKIEKKLLKDFKVVAELEDKITPILNTNVEGSEAVFRYGKLIDPVKGIALVELYNPTTKEFDKCKVRFRNNVIRLILAEKITEGKLYYIQYLGKEKIKGGRSVCKFDIKEISGSK